MTDSNKKLLLVVAAIAILLIAYMYVYSPTQQDNDTLDSEIETLEARYNDLKAKEANREQLLQETEEYNQQFDEMLAYYPAELNQEVTVMFMKGIEEQFDFVNQTVALPRDSQFYVLGQGMEEGEQVVDEELITEDSYVCNTGEYSISYTGTYESLKDFMDYIANYRYRMNISSITATYNLEEGTCAGTVGLNLYSISGPGREADTVDVDVPTGVDNIFVGGSGSASSSASVTYEYDSDNGESIITDNNLTIMLNDANNDAASGIIVAADDGDEDTYVTSNANEAVDLTISVYTAEGKNFVSYEIGDESYEQEILTDDVTIYVQSSERVNADDTNGVNVTVSNTTSMPVFFKVVDDDSASPRFRIVNRSGVVKVY